MPGKHCKMDKKDYGLGIMDLCQNRDCMFTV